MKSKRIAELLFITATLCFLVGIMLLTAIRERETISHYENRYLTTFPVLTSETVLDGGFFREVDEFLSDHMAFRTTLSRMDALADLYLIRRPVVNEVVVLPHLLLHHFPPSPMPEPEFLAERAAARAGDLYTIWQIVKGYGGQFLYVAVPDQTAYFRADFPAFVNSHDGYRPHVAAFTAAVTERGVPFLDMGEIFAARGNPFHYYSGVDHHFSFAGAFATYEAIMQALGLSYLSEAEFIFTELPNPYVGSRGRNLWGVSPFTETLSIAEPIVPIPFTRFDNGEERPPTVFYLPETDWEEVYYTIYMGGDHAKTEIDTKRPELPSLLIFGDSFTNAVQSLIYVNFNTMTALDFRHFHDMTLAEFLVLHQPDVVVGIRDHSWLLRVGQE